MGKSEKRTGKGVVTARGRRTVRPDPCSQETDSASGAAPSPGGPGFVVPRALHVPWPRCRPLLIPRQWPRGPGSRPPCLPLALTHRSLPALRCPWEGMGRTGAVEAFSCDPSPFFSPRPSTPS